MNLLRRKRASYQWNILQVTKYLETNTTRKQSRENNCQNYNIITLSPQRSANNGAIQVNIRNQPTRNDLKIFQSSANTHTLTQDDTGNKCQVEEQFSEIRDKLQIKLSI